MLTVCFCAGLAAARTFTGPGLYTDASKWGGGLPVATDVDNIVKGLCGVTNHTDMLYGGKWFHVGSGSAGYVLANNAHFNIGVFRIGDAKPGVFEQTGGSIYFGATALGYSSGYGNAQLYLKDVAATNTNNIVVGDKEPKDVANTYMKVEGGTFRKTGGSTTVQWGTSMSFDNVYIPSYSGFIYVNNGMLSYNNCVFTNLSSMSGSSSAGKTGIVSIVNSVFKQGKSYFGGASKATSIMNVSNSKWAQEYQIYIGGSAGATSFVTAANSELKYTTKYLPEIGYGANSYGEFLITGKDSKLTEQVTGGYIFIASGSNSVGRLIYDGVDFSKASFSVHRASCEIDATSYLIYRNLEGQRTYPIMEPYKAGVKGTYTIFDNSHYKRTSGNTFMGSTGKTNIINVVNGATFRYHIDTGILWFMNAAKVSSTFNVTNSPLFAISGTGYITHEKEGAALKLNFHDSTAQIATNNYFKFGHGAGSVASLSISGNSHVLARTFDCSANGKSEFNLNGGVFEVLQIGGASATINFNGGTMKAWQSISQISNAAIPCNVMEGGAIFDTVTYTNSIATKFLHAGNAAKDGGIVKKGSGKLVLTAASGHTFTGDIIVENGEMDISAATGFTMTQGQKIGGSGTLVPGDGFVAGGIASSTDAAGALTVDGAVEFTEGATVSVDGLTVAQNTSSRINLLVADSIIGADRLVADELPPSWKIVYTATTVDLVPVTGTLLMVK